MADNKGKGIAESPRGSKDKGGSVFPPPKKIVKQMMADKVLNKDKKKINPKDDGSD